MGFSPEVAAVLGSYVYVYIDPRTNTPFYIGKGVGNRAFAHLEESTETEKVQKIRELRNAGIEPKIDILRYGLTDAEAALVEASSIDLIGKQQLTNRVSGLHSRSFGRIDSKEIIAMLTAKPVEVVHKAVLFTINKLFRSDMSSQELYEATRGVWKIGTKRDEVEFAFAVYQGVVREVYQVEAWFPAGTMPYSTREAPTVNVFGRWEFKGRVAPESIRNMYIGFSVGPSGQNPFRYANI